MSQQELSFKITGDSTQGVVATARMQSALQGVGDQSARVGAGLDSVGASLAGMGGAATTAGSKIGAALDQLRAIEATRIRAEIDKVNAAYARVASSSTLMSEQLRTASVQHRETVARLNADLAKLGTGAEVSARQTAQAFRQLPMQLQDAFVSLAGGMNPLMVALQQGPQITGAFGGIRATMTALGAAITPVAAVGGSLAAVLAAMAAAAYQGAAETRALEAALIATHGRAGLASDQLSSMAQRLVGMAGVARGQAADALALMSAQSGIGARNIEQLTAVALRLQAVGGPAVGDTAAQFAALAREPLSASVKLNETTGYLTESVYKQIRALEARGQREQAAQVAQQAWAAAVKETAAAMEVNLGSLERTWRSLADGARKAWDSMLNIGRPDTLDEQIAAAEKKVAELQAFIARGGRKGWFGVSGSGTEGAETDLAWEQADLAKLRQRKAAEAAAAEKKGTAAAAVKKLIDRDGTVGDTLRANAAAQLGLELALAKAASDANLRAQDAASAALQTLRTRGLVSEQEAARQSTRIEQERLTLKMALIAQEISAEERRQVKESDIAGQLAKAAKLVDLKGQLAATGDQMRANAIGGLNKVAEADLADSRALATQWAASWQQAADRATALADQTAAAQIALITNPTEAARQQAELTISQMLRDAAVVRVSYDALISQLRTGGQASAADALRAVANRVDQRTRDQAAAMRGQVVADYLRDATAGLAAGWDGVTQSIGRTVGALLTLHTEQSSYAAAMKAAAGDRDSLARVELQHAQAQAGAYADIAGAAKGLFKSHTAGYKAMQTVERAYRGWQMVSAVTAAARELGLIGTVTAAKVAGVGIQTTAVAAGQGVETAAVVAGETERNAAKVPGVFLSFMSSLGPWGMAAAAAAIAAVWSASGTRGSAPDMSEQRQAANGTGTVLGDPSAKSQSISQALKQLGDVNTMTMRYSASMAASLANIEAAMSGVAVQILRSGGITSGSNLGIATGTAVNQGDGLLGLLGINDRMLTRNLPVAGNIIGALQGLWGKTSSEITDAGLALKATVSQLLGGSGLQQYADVRVSESSWFGLSKSQSTRTVTQGVGAELSRQFGLVFQGVSTSLQQVADALGLDTSRIGQQMAGYVLDIPRLSLQGLSGSALQEAIAAAVGAQADTLAHVAISGMDSFQRVGEGYYETVVRVGTGSEQARQALRSLGVTVVSLADVTNKQAADLGAELARSSLVRAETMYSVALGSITSTVSGIGQVIGTLSGTATELRDAYVGLINVRTAFSALGLAANSVGTDLLAGAGSLDALTSGVSAYEEHFATATERLGARSATLRDAFDRLGLAMPTSAAAYRDLVRGIDTTTGAGRTLLGQVLTLADGMGQLLDAVQSTTSGIADEIARIRGLMGVSSTAGQSLAALQATFAVQAAQARAGDSTALIALPSASKALLDAAANLVGSRMDLVRLQAGTATTLQAVKDAVDAAALSSAGAIASSPASAVATGTAGTSSASDPALQDVLAELSALRQTLAQQATQAAARDAEITALQQAVAAATAETARILSDVSQGGTSLSIVVDAAGP